MGFGHLLTNCATRLESEEAHYTRLVEQYRELEAKVERLENVTPEMIAAGMEAWDLNHSQGERSWPVMLEKVYTAMGKAALEGEQGGNE